MKIIFFLFLAIISISCEVDAETPIFYHEYNEFQTSDIGDVEKFIKNVSNKWNLKIFEKDRESMRLLTQNQDAFFIGLYQGNQHILTITNVGVPSSLKMSIYECDDLSEQNLKKLEHEIIAGLSDLGIHMIPVAAVTEKSE